MKSSYFDSLGKFALSEIANELKYEMGTDLVCKIEMMERALERYDGYIKELKEELRKFNKSPDKIVFEAFTQEEQV